MSARVWQFGGVAAAGGVAYYLYNAGGNPKVAEKKFEADAAKLSSNMTSGMSGKGTEAQKHGEALAADAGARIDNAFKDAKAGVSKIDSKLEGYRKEAESAIDSKTAEAQARGKAAVDSFDKNVTEGASKAKSSVSGWFGGK
ncbi:hypothetical protein LTR36_010475 [Oleoguttula mirabilis]|uniref:Calcofluor white hypersensitive protein n=1 Tax=Oleoguttula mirabilis TaxID=1507867 RepID=A0AAV9J419_9PEZI|nr:hypothetical protein LTR36_010475 [Oleoguttula mirabilis]